MVRPAVVADAATLADIHVTSWQVTYRGVFDEGFLEGLDRRRRESWFADLLARGGVNLLVEPDDQPVAFCWFGDPFAPEEEGGWAELYSIYAHPDHWGMGHGYRLLAHAESEMIEAGYDRALLWVLDRNSQARAFYERQGWELANGIKLERIGGTPITEVRYEYVLRGSL